MTMLQKLFMVHCMAVLFILEHMMLIPEIKEEEEIIKRHKENLTMIFFFLGYLLGESNQYIFKKCDLTSLMELSKDINAQIKDTLNRCLEKHK